MNFTTSCPLFCRPADVIQFHHDNEANGRGQNARGMKDEMMMNPGRCPFLHGGHETYAGAQNIVIHGNALPNFICVGSGRALAKRLIKCNLEWY